jgi:hypothetical protein
MNIIHISTHDWEVLYGDGIRLDEDHRLRTADVLDQLNGHTVESVTRVWFDEEEVEELNWQFPEAVTVKLQKMIDEA